MFTGYFTSSSKPKEPEVLNVTLIKKRLRNGTTLIIEVPNNLTLKESADLQEKLSETINAFLTLEEPVKEPFPIGLRPIGI